MNANQSRLDAVDNTGEQLIGDEHYASDQIRERLDELHKLWAYLFERSNDKGSLHVTYKTFLIQDITDILTGPTVTIWRVVKHTCTHKVENYTCEMLIEVFFSNPLHFQLEFQDWK